MGQVFKPGVGVDFGATAAMFSGDYADKGHCPMRWPPCLA